MCSPAVCVLTISLGLGAFAQDLGKLKPGLYVLKVFGCERAGSAASMTFDGKNLSGHYQVCRTDHISSGKYRFSCIESQGQDRGSLEQIDSDPDKTMIEQNISIRSSTEFAVEGTEYRLCAQ